MFAYGPADATASQNPVISCLVEMQTGFTFLVPAYRWLGSRVVSVLDSGAQGLVQIEVAMLSGNCAHCAPLYQAAKLVAALLRVVEVTAGLAESNGSLPPGL